MAAPRTPQAKQEEPHIMLVVPYNTHMVIPARVAGEFLPYVRCVQEEWKEGTYTYTLGTEPLTFKLLAADVMAAAAVTAELTKGE